ncbi:MAG: hypothetical protein RIC36_09855 [Rhodospirillales bacterium]
MTIPLSSDIIMPAGAISGKAAPASPQPAATEVLPWLERQSGAPEPAAQIPAAQIPAALATPPGDSQLEDLPDDGGGELSLWGEDGFDFWDLLDVINPLQHIPFVNTLYREMTGDEIGAAPRLAGGLLFGGPIGLAFSGANVAVEAMSGQDIGEHAVALWKGAVEYGQEDVVVAGSGGQAASQQAATQTDPVALAQQSLAADSAGWSRVQATAAAGNNANINAFSSPNMFHDVVAASPVGSVRATPTGPATFSTTPATATKTPNSLGSAAVTPAAFTAKSPETRWFPVNKPRNPVQPGARANPLEFAQATEDVTRFRDDQPRVREQQLSEAQIKSALLQAQVNSRGMNVPATSYSARKATVEGRAPVDPASAATAQTSTEQRAAKPEPALAGTGSSLIDAQIATSPQNAPEIAGKGAAHSDADWFAQAMSQGLSKYQGYKNPDAARN